MKTEMNLDFLNNVTLQPVDQLAPKKREQVSKLPEEADIRVFANGDIFPSEEFIESAQIEYQDRVPLDNKQFKIVGNGVDVFSSVDWGMLQGKLPTELVFASIVAKAEHKVSLWSSSKYDDNKPKASVKTQGNRTFGKNTLLPMLAEVYGINWETTKYVDLTLDLDHQVSSPDNVYYIPKIVSSGDNKGKKAYVRRENMKIFPLLVTDVKEASEATKKKALIEPVETTEPADLQEQVVVDPVEVKADEPSADNLPFDTDPDENVVKEEPQDEVPDTNPSAPAPDWDALGDLGLNKA